MLRSLLQKSVNLVPWSLRSRIKDLPLVASFQRWLVRSIIGVGEFEHTINAGPGAGLRVRISLPREKGLWTGTYENHFVGAIAEAVPHGGVCFDLGGFRGFVSGVMALRGASQVFCFEPLPGNIEVIRGMMALNPTLPIQLRPEAVGAADGSATFDVMEDASMGKLDSSAFEAERRGQSKLTVPVRSLDSLLAAGQIVPPALMKIDVEGAELEVLKGCAEVLSRGRPVIFAEIHSAELLTACTGLLQGLRYDVQVMTGSGAAADQASQIHHICARPLGSASVSAT